ncbi:glycosyltransferase family 4 protein [Actinokineospora sp. 24-640]
MHFILPGDVDDPASVSGGNVYDRRVVAGLAALGVRVREIPVAGTWPRPDPPAKAALARALARAADGTTVVLDGLVACGVPEVLVPEATRLRLVVLLHLPLADEIGLAPLAAAALSAAERLVLTAAAAVVATSPWAADRLVREHGLDPGKVRSVAPGVDPAPTAPGTAGGKRLLCVASLTPRKGHDVLVTALAGLTDLEWTCACVGPDGRDRAHARSVRRLARDPGLANRVRFTGPRTGAALEAEYAAADLLVLPSRAETYGMVVTEALARGTPVLASAAGGVPEALGSTPDGVPGVLVPPGDADALGKALRLWLERADLRRHLRHAAVRRRGELTDWRRTAREIATALAEVRR